MTRAMVKNMGRFYVATADEQDALPVGVLVMWCRSEEMARNFADLLNNGMGGAGLGPWDRAPSAHCGRSHVIVDSDSLRDALSAMASRADASPWTQSAGTRQTRGRRAGDAN